MASPKRRVVLVIVVLLVCLSTSCLTPATPSPEPTVEPLPLVEMPELRSPAWEKYAGQQVTVEGIFVRDPLPMLVTDLDIVRRNMAMPEDRYLLLSGPAAERISDEKWGGARLRFTGNVVAAAETVKELNFGALYAISYRFVEATFTHYAVVDWRVKIRNELRLINKYAVLFSGGINASNNHTRYWNDLKFMYSTLVDTLGFDASHVTVLYADGAAVDTDMPVDHAATQANLNTVFTDLRNTTTSNDTIFFFTTNHGSGFYANDPDQLYNWYGGQWDANADEPSDSINESSYHLDLNGDGDQSDIVGWDESLRGWGPAILDDSLTTIITNLKYSRMVIVMEQCFSGGVIHDLRGTNRIIMSAAGEYEPSWSGPTSSYDEFSYYFTSALNGADPDGNAVDADDNNDGKVSMVEAFNYARSNDSNNETPWYEDSGDGVPHIGNMPGGGDGTLGTNTFL